MISFEKLNSLINDRFHGHLKAGKHESNGECCALELLSVARDLPWTDDPDTVRCWDLRSLNDIDVPDDVRREYLLPVIAAYDGSMDWPKDRQCEVASRLAILTINRLVSGLPGLPANIAARCKGATDLSSARSAAAAAAAAAEVVAAAAAAAARSVAAAWSSEVAAAWSSEVAAEAAAAAAAEARVKIFTLACGVWLDALKPY